MKDTIAILEQLGIDDKQTKVYLAALELGSATVQELSNKSSVKRTSIYNFLEEMEDFGLVTKIKEGKHTLLIAQDPNLLLQKAKDQVQNLNQLLPELLGVFNRPGNKPKVKYYKGIKGLERAYEDLIETGETVYGFSDYEKMFDVMDNKYLQNFPPRRAKKKIFFYCVAKEGKHGKKIKNMDKQHLRKTYLVKNLELDTEINIYGNKVMMLSFCRPYAGVIIEDRAIAVSMKSVWKMVWGGLK